jgi:glycerophosphoryl diester phosphodiesterase
MSTVCGHRGLGPSRAGARLPENTLESIVAAIAEGAAMVEFDIQITRDDVPVLMHDDTLDRTTSGSGCVSAHTLAEVRSMDAGVGTPQEARGVRVPTLSELLATVSIPLNVEIKVADDACRAHDATRVAEVVLAALREDPSHASRTLLISSFDLELLREVRKLDAHVPLGWLIEHPGDHAQWLARAVDAGCQALHPYHLFITSELAERCHERGVQLNTWTVNDAARARQLAGWGVHTLITDDPATVRAALGDPHKV